MDQASFVQKRSPVKDADLAMLSTSPVNGPSLLVQQTRVKDPSFSPQDDSQLFCQYFR